MSIRKPRRYIILLYKLIWTVHFIHFIKQGRGDVTNPSAKTSPVAQDTICRSRLASCYRLRQWRLKKSKSLRPNAKRPDSDKGSIHLLLVANTVKVMPATTAGNFVCECQQNIKHGATGLDPRHLVPMERDLARTQQSTI